MYVCMYIYITYTLFSLAERAIMITPDLLHTLVECSIPFRSILKGTVSGR